MAVSGRPLGKTKNEIAEAIINSKGILTRVAVELNCSLQTVYVKIEEYDLQSVVDEARKLNRCKLADKAEILLDKVMDNYEKDPNNAVKCAFYTLNNHGKDRGYTKDNYQQVSDPIEVMNQVAHEKKSTPR